jgi:DNA-binding MarR family transcriptional regulator
VSRKQELVARLGQETRAAQAATDALDEAVAARFGVNRTDLRCLEVLLQELEAATPGQLAGRLGLTTGSVTAMLDRLARLGYLTRSPDPSDRRKVIVRATELTGRLAAEIYGPLAEFGGRELSHYTADELDLLIAFQQLSRRLQENAVTRVRALPAVQPPTT